MSNDELWKLYMKVQIVGGIAAIVIHAAMSYADYLMAKKKQKMELEKIDRMEQRGLPERKTREMFGMEWSK